MSVIFVVVPLATLVVLVAVIAFVMSARHGQFDDLDTPAVRMLHDDARVAGDVAAESARGTHDGSASAIRRLDEHA